jgi:putative membrane protein
VLAGLVASWVKAFSEPRLQTVAELILPPSAAQKLEVGADPSGHPQNMPPAVIVGRVASALGYAGLTDGQRVSAQRVIHYTLGAGLGVAYGSAASRWPATTRGAGRLAGLAIYAGSHGSVLPALGIQRPPWRLAPAAVAWEATSHIIFGAALETARRLVGASR